MSQFLRDFFGNKFLRDCSNCGEPMGTISNPAMGDGTVGKCCFDEIENRPIR